MNNKHKTVILGLGNTLLSDDGVGVYVAQEVEKALNGNTDVHCKEIFSPGFELIEEILGYKRAILVDAIISEKEGPGQIFRYTPEDFRDAIHISTYHDMNFPTSLALSRKLNMDVPDDILIVAITVEDILTLREECTDKVKEAIPKAVELILGELNIGER